MALQVVWAKVNLGTDKRGKTDIARQGDILPTDYLSEFERASLVSVGALKYVPDPIEMQEEEPKPPVKTTPPTAKTGAKTK